MSDKIPMPWKRVFNEVDKIDRSEGFDIGFKDESFLNLWGIIPDPEGSIYEGQKLISLRSIDWCIVRCAPISRN